MNQPKDVESIIEEMFQQPMLDTAQETGKVQRLNISQTINNHIISLRRAYADGCNIIIVCIVENSEEGTYLEHLTTLNDSQDNFYPDANSHYNGIDGLTQLVTLYFDATGSRGNAEELNLHLEIDTAAGNANNPHARFMRGGGVSGSWSSSGGLVHRVSGQAPPSPEEIRAVRRKVLAQQGQEVETFVFDFTVPFTPARIAEPNQTVEANGTAVTLDRVIIAPSSNKIYLHATSGKEATRMFTPMQGVLNVPGEMLGAELQLSRSSGEATEFRCTNELYGKEGEWTITITQVRGYPIPTSAPVLDKDGKPDMKFYRRFREGFNTLLGPWVFKFTVPPAD